ncbi:MAG: tyrosine-type recombinase/integrase [Bacteroidales bacterium]|nr:tyrosine-type recombinase/integrase [Bacteroidales bacterium]
MTQFAKVVHKKSANFPVLCRERIGICTIALTLSSKRGSAGRQALPVCLRFSLNGGRYYYLLGDSWTVGEFSAICTARKGLRRHDTFTRNDLYYAKQEEYRQAFARCVARIRDLALQSTLTLDKISAALTGKSGDGKHFLSEWERILDSRGIGTAESYRYALRSFRELTGFTPRDGFLVNTSVLACWVRKMKARGYSKATIGIYLRACRVVVKECVRLGYIRAEEYPFGERDASLISIPKGRSRKEKFLSVSQMTQLYRFFSERREAELPLRYEYQRVLVRQSLGLFLFLYLANGMNLSDAARLRYDAFWFEQGGRALRFERQKTRDRADNNSEVIVPIIPQLADILLDTAAPEQRGQLLFPFILDGVREESACRKKVNLMNSNISARMEIVARHLGWSVSPTPTWCRHSFATNLSLAGVPTRYISESMGHSPGHSVTAGYIAEFPLEKQMAFNRLLLAGENGPDDAARAGNLLSGLSPEMKRELLKQLLDG